MGNKFNQFLLFIRKHLKKTVFFMLLILAYAFCLPSQLFNVPYSTVIESENGVLLGAKIADDEQWRFPESDSIPHKFEQCIIQFEDAHFYHHFGFNPVSILKAMQTNFAKGKIVSGASTITQQVIRLSRQGKSRTYFEKIYELILATRLEFRASKFNIFKAYVAHAPFGGNVVGLEVASWRYFGVQPYQLSWAESATLAVLPNAPSLIYPGKNQLKLLQKRNRLLIKLFNNKIIDKLTYQLAIQEPLPKKPYAIPQIAPHLLQEVSKKNKGKRVQTSINDDYQQSVNRIVDQHYNTLKENGIHNMAVLVLNVKTKKVVSYVGNTRTTKANQKDVNIITAPRSTGSVLKPLLYMAMLDKGEILPNTLVADIPTTIADYQPQNFNLQYSGAISAKKALAKSLNVPAVRMLHEYGLGRFYDELTGFNLKDVNRGIDHYGLSLILGGAESSLWDLCSTYMNLAGTVNHFTATESEYYVNEYQKPSFKKALVIDLGLKSFEKTIFDSGSIYLGFEAMKEVNRPEHDQAWKFYDSSQEIAWKTGTSFGNRDAWAIGVTGDFVVGVWVGNADGEGRPNLTGLNSAAPVLFDVYNVLPKSEWFKKPLDELEEIEVCAQSGYLASELCELKKELVPVVGKRFKSCPFHHLTHIDKNNSYRVNASCESLENINTISWFTLPPLQEWYYKKYNANYLELPPLRIDCSTEMTAMMDFIFPKNNSKISLVKNEDEIINPIVFKLAHTRPETKIFWYLDEEYIATTEVFHEIALTPKIGKHLITVVDQSGNELQCNIEILH